MRISKRVTELLSEVHRGEPEASDQLMSVVYSQLRRMAASQFKRERRNHTLEPTALVHEACIRLVRPGAGPWKSREHFFSVAARAMRHILVDYARARNTGIRGGDLVRVDLAAVQLHAGDGLAPVTELNAALEKLEVLDPRKARIVELRFFAGLTVRETAAVLAIGVTTVKQEWALAKAWLQREMSPL